MGARPSRPHVDDRHACRRDDGEAARGSMVEDPLVVRVIATSSPRRASCLMAWLTLVMRGGILAALALLMISSAYAQHDRALSGPRMIDVDGRAVRIHAIGLQDRRPGAPVVVFEAGAGNSLEVWGDILAQVAPMAPLVAYDRAGLGSSEWDNATPTPRHVALFAAIGLCCRSNVARNVAR